MIPSARLQTKYPKIYECYWGQSRRIVEVNIIENRNSFINEYNIKRSMRTYTKKYVRNIFDSVEGCDHHELYVTNDNNLILIMSLYDPNRIIHGWEIIKPLYSQGVTTYMKMITNNYSVYRREERMEIAQKKRLILNMLRKV